MTNVDYASPSPGAGTRGRTPIWRIVVEDEELVADVLSAELFLTENSHDMVNLALSSTELLEASSLMDKPITFAFGMSPRTERFYGYIVAVNETSSNPDALNFNLLVLGATYPMQGGEPRFWSNLSIPGVIQRLVQGAGLGYAGPTHPYLWKSLSQTGESDWEKAAQLARRLGWKLYSRYGAVWCIEPEQILRESGPYTTFLAGDAESFSTQDERVMLEFDATEESDETPDTIGHTLGYFDGRRAQTIEQEGDFLRYKFRTDIVVRNREEAELYRDGFDTADSTDRQAAAARLLGEADLYPGMVVNVVARNWRIYQNRFDGPWLISSVRHKMDRSSFQTQVSLVRPARTEVADDPYRSFWDLEGLARPSMGLEETDEESRWVSSWVNRRAE